VSRSGDLWICGKHRILCGDSTSADAVAQLLGDRKPKLMVTDPPYGIELDTEWRDRAGLNGCGPAEASYMKQRTKGHTETSISGDTRADWSQAFELVPSIQIAYVCTLPSSREVLDGLIRIGFLYYPQQIIWDKAHGPDANSLLVSARALLVCAQEERGVVRQGRRELDRLGFRIAEVHHGRQ
jgi:hypothetical protein